MLVNIGKLNMSIGVSFDLWLDTIYSVRNDWLGVRRSAVRKMYLKFYIKRKCIEDKWVNMFIKDYLSESKVITRLFIPLYMSQVTYAVSTFVSTLMVAHLGKSSLAALALVSSV